MGTKSWEARSPMQRRKRENRWRVLATERQVATMELTEAS